MARSETIISVFVASPGDVIDERIALESIISELNRTWSRTLNLRLELIKWETDIHPSFGAYPQDVINRQLNDEYDVFIALFWSKVGSPTDVAESGTVEEFERAYQKFQNNPKSVELMVYFKDQAILPSKMDLVQLQKLQSLKEQLGDKGGLYWTFDNTEDFENLLRGHLSRVAQSWAQKLIHTESIKTEEVNETKNPEYAVDESEDDYGLFDYLDIYEDRMSDMTSALELMTDATVKVGTQFDRRTAEITKLTSANVDGSYDQKEARKIIKLISGHLTRYSEILDSQVNIATSSRTESFDALSKGISISIELTTDGENLYELKQNLRDMLLSASGAKDDLSTFKESIASLPRLSIQINKAKRIAIRSLDRVLGEVRKTIKSTNDVLETIQKIENEKI